MLKHPLVFAVPYIEQHNALYNEQYKRMQKALRKARKTRDWGSFISLYQRPHQYDAFIEIGLELRDEEYWALLGDIWVGSENRWVIRSLGPLLRSPRGSRECIMNAGEREFLSQLPDRFMVYRGHQSVNRGGFSWTLSYNRARWFAQRPQTGAGHVAIASVHKNDVLAYFGRRGEFEIVVDPTKVEIKTLRKLKRPGILPTILEDCVRAFPLGGRWSDHGRLHWEAVERNAIHLAKKTEGADEFVCRLFAITHDCQRENETVDPEHGHRAADFILKNRANWGLKDFGEERLDKLLDACRRHNDGQVSDDPTVGVCWDADRLDLPRVGIAPDPRFLSTDAGRKSIWLI